MIILALVLIGAGFGIDKIEKSTWSPEKKAAFERHVQDVKAGRTPASGTQGGQAVVDEVIHQQIHFPGFAGMIK